MIFSQKIKKLSKVNRWSFLQTKKMEILVGERNSAYFHAIANQLKTRRPF
jgi:hypothetical protein